MTWAGSDGRGKNGRKEAVARIRTLKVEEMEEEWLVGQMELMKVRGKGARG